MTARTFLAKRAPAYIFQFGYVPVAARERARYGAGHGSDISFVFNTLNARWGGGEATPEEKAAWRTENGIPESPDKYDLTLKDGLVLKSGDKEVVDGFLKVAHERNMRQEDVTETLNWWADHQAQTEQAAAARDHEARMASEVELRQEYGPEYQRNMKIANDVLATAPGDVKERL
ncbi:hypothetical protein EBX93_18130, partial [bacterium]|nr:hypothetical protein [bacterium]